ncbi:MAG: ester cyclase [Ignavibacteriae bacterium]|nr:ester cyclase [Ignavibacteriota bacterium]
MKYYSVAFCLLLITGSGTAQQSVSATTLNQNKVIVKSFIDEFWNTKNTAGAYRITCVCGENVNVTADNYETAVTTMIPAMDKHVAAKEHPQVPKNLTPEMKNGMVRATMVNSVLEKFLSEKYIEHSLPPGMPQGAASAQMMAMMFKHAFPDLAIAIEDQIAEGDKVVSRVVLTGTNTGPFMEMPATNQQIRMTGIRIDRIANGKIVEHWAVADQMSMMQQLGVMPMTSEPKK